MKILIVEDDPTIAEILRNGLTACSYITDVSSDGADGSFMARSFEYDAIVLDYSLPKKNGLVVCKEIRDAGKTMPIIFLSATDEVEIKVAALQNGADDYMIKPFSLDELNARLQALFRRPQKIQDDVLKVYNLSLNTKTSPCW